MHYNSIQWLRGIAASGVVLCHTLYLNVGAAGVDLFFVISGFIIAMVMRDKQPGQFLFDRFWRVFPLYWLLLIPWLGADPAKLWTSITLWPVWGGYVQPYLRVAWTLSFEVLFYTAAAVSLALGSPRIPLIAYAVALAWFIIAPNPLVAFVGNPMILLFLAGAAIFHLPKNAMLGGALLVGGIVLFSLHNIAELNGIVAKYQTAAMAGFRLLYWGIPAAMVIYGAVSLERYFTRPSRLGDASYSIYLVHPAIVHWLDQPWPVEFSLSLLAGLAVHSFMEKPILRAKPQFTIWRRRPDEGCNAT